MCLFGPQPSQVGATLQLWTILRGLTIWMHAAHAGTALINHAQLTVTDFASERAIPGNGAPGLDALDEDMIHQVVHSFYDSIRGDHLLGPIFDRAIAPDAWPSHLAKLCDFWSSVLLKTSRYNGRPLPPHLRIPELGEEHFRRWLLLFRATVHEICPPEVAAVFMDRALRIAHSFRLAVAFNRGEDTLAIAPISEASL